MGIRFDHVRNGVITHAEDLALLAKDAQATAAIVNKYITVKLRLAQFPVGPDRFLQYGFNKGH